MQRSAGALFFSIHLKTAGGDTLQKLARLEIPPTSSAAFDINDCYVFSITNI
jgi:hypothetical protein